MTKIRKRRKKKRVKIVERKLGREKSWGLCWGDGLIEVEKRLPPKRKFFCTIHEILHHVFRDGLSESKVRKAETIIGNALWDQNYRKVEI